MPRPPTSSDANSALGPSYPPTNHRAAGPRPRPQPVRTVAILPRDRGSPTVPTGGRRRRVTARSPAATRAHQSPVQRSTRAAIEAPAGSRQLERECCVCQLVAPRSSDPGDLTRKRRRGPRPTVQRRRERPLGSVGAGQLARRRSRRARVHQRVEGRGNTRVLAGLDHAPGLIARPASRDHSVAAGEVVRNTERIGVHLAEERRQREGSPLGGGAEAGIDRPSAAIRSRRVRIGVTSRRARTGTGRRQCRGGAQHDDRGTAAPPGAAVPDPRTTGSRQCRCRS